MEFQTNLKKLRTEEGLTQDQLALLVETSTDTIGRIERKQKIASYEVLFRIARYFDKPVEDVFWYEWENGYSYDGISGIYFYEGLHNGILIIYFYSNMEEKWKIKS